MKRQRMYGSQIKPAPFKNERRSQRNTERGAALLIALALIMLMMALSLVMYYSLSSDSAINGYYRDFRGAYYAADSGINIASEYIANQILTNSTWTNGATVSNPNTAPLNPTSIVSTIQTALNNQYYNTFTSLDSGNASSSWPASFELVSNANATPEISVTCQVQGTGAGLSATNCSNPCPTSPCSVTGYQYIFNYMVTVVGQSKGTEQTKLQETGQVSFSPSLTAGSSTVSFASFGLFIDAFADCQGPLVPGLFSGPTFTNQQWNFGNFSTNYTFIDNVGQQNAKTSWWFGGTCKDAAGNSDTYSGATIAPAFNSGFKQGQPAMTLPSDTYGQEAAVLDSTGMTCNGSTPQSEGAPTQTQMANGLKNAAGTSWPSSGSAPSTGVYLPWTTVNGTKTFSGGGILVQGTAGVKLAATTDTAGNPTETYTITQSGVTTTVVIDNTANTTTISDTQGNVQTITGVPQQYTISCPGSSTTAAGPATLLYVSGSISGLQGPYSGNTAGAAVANGTALTIASPGNITVTGDIKYAEEPVTLNNSDSLIPANNQGQVLGIYTNSYIQFNIDNNSAIQHNGDNIEIDASLAAIQNGATSGLQTPGSVGINKWTNVGGRIENIPHGVNINSESIYYDRRFSAGLVPPWFPSTTITSGSVVASIANPVASRTQWLDISHQ